MVLIKCRTCLENSKIKSSSSITEEFLLGKSFKEVILLFVPQMVTAIGIDDVICINCAELLKSFAKFIKRCMAVEKVLRRANEQKKEILRRNKEVNSELTKNSLTKSKLREINSECFSFPHNANENKIRLQHTQDLQEHPDQPSFKSIKPRSIYSDTHGTVGQTATKEEAVEVFDTKVVIAPIQSTTEKIKCNSCGTVLSNNCINNSTEIKCKKCLLKKDGETVPLTVDIFGKGSTNDDDNLPYTFEEIAEADDTNDTKQIEAIKSNKIFNIIEEGSLDLYPMKHHNRVISVTHTNEIITGAIKSNIEIYQYGPPKEGMGKKRILLFGSVIVQCPNCKVTFKNARNLNYHIKTVHCDITESKEENNKTNNSTFNLTKKKNEKSTTVLSCPICNITVQTTRLLTSHLYKAHADYKPYVCEKCGRNFKTKYAQAKHFRKYQKFESCDVRKCYFCSEMVSRKDYPSHSKTHAKSFVCNECGEAFVAAHHLELHSVKHRIKKENLQLCPVCGKMTKHLVSHLKIHETGPRKYMCHKCPKLFMTESHLTRHVRCVHLGIRNFQCKECKMKFNTASHLKEHNKLLHSNNFSHTCELCGKGFTHIDYLRKHINKHTFNRRSIRRRYRYTSDELPGPAKCKYCSKLFKTVHRLRVHLLTHVKRQRYKCNFCTLTFSTYANKHKHEQRHKRPYFELSCEICWKRVETKEELGKHMTKHESAKKYECQYCGMLYARQYLLNHHISESHTNIEDIEKEKEAMLADALEEFLL